MVANHRALEDGNVERLTEALAPRYLDDTNALSSVLTRRSPEELRRISEAYRH